MIDKESKRLLRAIIALVVLFAFPAMIAIIAGEGFVFLKKTDKKAKEIIKKASQYEPTFEIVEKEDGVYNPRFFKKKKSENDNDNKE